MNASTVFRIEKILEIELYEAAKRCDWDSYKGIINVLTCLYSNAKYDPDDIDSLISEIESSIHARIIWDK